MKNPPTKRFDRICDNVKSVSSVVGVILIIFLTVALVSLVTVVVFNTTEDNVGKSADATLRVQETSDGIEVSVLRNRNVKSFEVISGNGGSLSLSGDIGDTQKIAGGNSKYFVVAVLDDGTREVIRTVDPTRTIDWSRNVPSISGFDAKNTVDTNMRVRFDSDEVLEEISVDVSGQKNDLLTEDDFTLNENGVYEGTYDGGENGDYNFELTAAKGLGGNNGADSESDSVTVAVDETTAPKITNFGGTNPIDNNVQVKLDSDKILNKVTVDISGPESAVVEESDFSRDGSTYVSTYSATKSGDYTVELKEAVGNNGFDGASGQSDTVSSQSGTGEPSITNFSATNPIDQDIRVSFDSNETLTDVRVNASGPENAILTEDNFTLSGGTYSATYESSSDGTYTVKLEVAEDESGIDGSDSLSDSVYLDTDYNAPPRARFTAPDSVQVGEKFEVNASDSTPGSPSDQEGSISEYNWDFSNTTTDSAIGVKADHTYDSTGTERIELRVVDTGGKSDTEEKLINIIEGSGDGSAETIDDFEDGDLSEYALSTSSDISTISSSYEGSQSLEIVASGDFETAISKKGDGLSSYPEAGDTFGAYVYRDGDSSSVGNIVYGNQDDDNSNKNRYRVNLNHGRNDLRVDVFKNGDKSKNLLDGSCGFPENQWYQVIVEWTTSGEHNVDVYWDGSQKCGGSITNSTYTSGGFGLIGFDNSNGNFRFDKAELNPSPMVSDDPSGSSLRAHWALNDTSGATLAEDFSGNDISGDIDGATPENPGIGGQTSFGFDGSEDKVYNNTLLDGEKGFTVSMWFNADDLSYTEDGHFNNHAQLIGRQGSTDDSMELAVLDTGDLGLYIDAGGGSSVTNTGGSVKPGKWYNAVVVHESGSAKVYLNDSEIMDFSVESGPIVSNSNPLSVGSVVGGNYGGNTFSFDGKVQDVRVYNETLSRADISDLYNENN